MWKSNVCSYWGRKENKFCCFYLWWILMQLFHLNIYYWLRHSQCTKCIKWTKHWFTIWRQLTSDFCFTSPGMLPFPVTPYCRKFHPTLCEVCVICGFELVGDSGKSGRKSLQVRHEKRTLIIPPLFWMVAFHLFGSCLWGSKSSLCHLYHKHPCLPRQADTHINTLTHTWQKVQIHKTSLGNRFV